MQNDSPDKMHKRFRNSTTVQFLEACDNSNEYYRQRFADLEKAKIVSYIPTSWSSSLFLTHGRAPLGRVWWVLVVSSVAYTVCMKLLAVEYEVSSLGHTLSGSALMFLVVLRTVNGVRKYWDAVAAWAGMSSACRDCASQVAQYITHDGIRARALKFIIVYCVAMRSYLRKEKIVVEEVAGILSPEDIAELNEHDSPPVHCIQSIRQCLATAVQKKTCLPFHMAVEKSLYNMSSNFSSCQKLLYPMPVAYISHLRTFVLLWLFTIIPVFYQFFSWVTPLVCGALSYALIGLENTAVQLEDPFGYDANDLPLDSVCAEIQRSILKIISGQLQFEGEEERGASKEDHEEQSIEVTATPMTCATTDEVINSSVYSSATTATSNAMNANMSVPMCEAGIHSSLKVAVKDVDGDIQDMDDCSYGKSQDRMFEL